MSISLTVRIPDDLWSQIEKYGRDNHSTEDGFDKTKTAISLFKTALNIPLDSESNAVLDIVRQDDLREAISRLRLELTETIDNRLDRQSESFAKLIAELKHNYQSEIDFLEITSEEHRRYAEHLEETSEGVSAASLEVIFEDEPDQNSIAVDKPENAITTVSSEEGLGNQALSDLTKIPVSTLEKWKRKLKQGIAITSRKHPDFFSRWELGKDDLWYPRQ
jgi:CHASE3 domain sensor protein